tara:strand:+ start:508 stop:795 length:288 start_codon:yes stop_codon:yes gene_type:complete
MNREQRRSAAKQAKSQGNEEMESKINLFEKLPDECLTCQKEFDKKDKEMVMSWSVVVREEKEEVRLYCPDCWKMAQEMIKNFSEHLKAKYEENEE